MYQVISIRLNEPPIIDDINFAIFNKFRMNSSCFANLLVANEEIEDDNSPKLRVEEDLSRDLQFQFEEPTSSHISINSSFVNSFIKIFSNQQLPETIREMSLREAGFYVYLTSVKILTPLAIAMLTMST